MRHAVLQNLNCTEIETLADEEEDYCAELIIGTGRHLWNMTCQGYQAQSPTPFYL